MLLPRFTIRRLLLITLIFGVISLVASHGVRGEPWAAGLTVAVGSILAAFLVYVIFFCAAWAVSKAMSDRPQPKRSATSVQVSPSKQIEVKEPD